MSISNFTPNGTLSVISPNTEFPLNHNSPVTTTATTVNTTVVTTVVTTSAVTAVTVVTEVTDSSIDIHKEQELRKLIINIQKDTNLSLKDKQTRIFALLNQKNHGKTCQHQHNHTNINNSSSDTSTSVISTTTNTTTYPRAAVKSLLTYVPVAPEDKYILSSGGAWIHIPLSQLHSTNQSGKCEHYTRGCSIYTECCRQFFSCRLCHDHVSDHDLDPTDVKAIRCHACHQIQIASNQCCNSMCKALFGEYYCSICKLWSTGVDIYHCSKCDICLRGKLDTENKHCDTCGYCMPVARFENHVCCKYDDEICAICGEDFKGCLGDFETTKCNHVFHASCMEKHVGSGDCTCPICRKTLFDMSSTWEEIDLLRLEEIIPDDFMSWHIEFQCNDCLTSGKSKFSAYGNKCLNCSSYNTTQINIIHDIPISSS